MANRKTCRICRKRLSLAAFNDSARTSDGLAEVCRACTNARRRQLDAARTERRQPPANLAAALRTGDLRLMKSILKMGMRPHWSWICEAMREGHLALVDLLLKSGATRNVFSLAAMADLNALRRRLRRSPHEARLTVDMPPNCIGVTPTHVACSSNFQRVGADRMAAQLEVVQLLTEHGADLNARGRYWGMDETTPIFCACWTSGNLALVEWLLKQGVIPTDGELRAALGHFQRHGRGDYAIAAALLDWGVPVDGVPGDRTPLQGFAHHAAHKTVLWLIERGAKVNSRGPGRRTALHLAAERNTGPKTLEVLVAHGGDLSAKDEDGHTPLDLARLNGKLRLVEWIKTQQRRRA